MYDVYISDMLLPIAPEKITTQINGKNETAILISDGEISILKSAGLTTVSFIALFPNVQYPFAQYPKGFKKAGHYVNKLQSLMDKKKPFQFIITRQTPVNKKLFNTNLTVSLESFQIVDDAKNGMDVEVQINLKQFREYGTKTFKVETPSDMAPIIVNPQRIESTSSGNGSSGGSSGGSKTKTYKVQIPGMSVLSIKATSVQGAITKACGTTWTGDIIVDGKTYYVVKGKISQRPANKSKTTDAVKKVVQKVTETTKKVVSTVSTVISKVTDALKKVATKNNTPAKTPTVVKKSVTLNLKNKMISIK
jgi:hypothetical protein